MEISSEEIFYLSLLDKNKHNIIFDIGCNKGYYTEFLLKNLGQAHEYYLFDPSKKFCDLSKIKFNSFDNIHIRNIAVSDKTKKNVDFYELSDINNEVEGMSSLSNRDVFKRYEYNIQKVDTIKLDDFVEENKISHIDFIKIDTEGHELKILNGLSKTLEKKIIDFIQIEYGDCSLENGFNLQDIINFFEIRKYSVYYYDHNLLQINDENCKVYEKKPWMNLLIRKI